MKNYFFNKTILFLYFFVSFIPLTFTQEINQTIITTSNPLTQVFTRFPNDKVILANSMADYPVTPGDVYKLVYIGNTGPSSLEAIVSADFKINFNIFGIMDVKNMRLVTLQTAIQKMILIAYPDSRPIAILQSNGIFQIYVRGEVTESTWNTCWALTRLSEIIQGKLTPYSSLRDIEIASNDGTVRTCDLFRFTRGGEKDQDVYLKPFDTVTIKRCGKQVTLNGQAYRPGSYQLKNGENLRSLMDFYGEGMTPLAGSTRIRIIRVSPDPGKASVMYYVNMADPGFTDFVLTDRDTVYVPDKSEPAPAVSVEGAIKNEGKVTLSISEGEKVSTFLLRNKDLFIPSSDLKKTYILREGVLSPIPVNAEAILSGISQEKDDFLKNSDRIIIPFRQFFISVSGAVMIPGKYPYVPDRTWQYYVGLAGGSDPTKNADNSVLISDISDKILPSDTIIQPEDRIYMPYTNAFYHINQWEPFLTVIIAAATLGVAFAQLIK